jgi:3-octaprenyl-4-hydroxybenzoate carboxy-lyase
MARPEQIHAAASAVSYRGLREWLTQVEKLGELERVNGAHWDREMGAITQMLTETGKGRAPAILFDEVPGYAKGYRTLYGQFSTIKRVALTLGLPLEYEHKADIVKAYHQRMTEMKLIKPKMSRADRFLTTSWKATGWTCSNCRRRFIIKRTRTATSAPPTCVLPKIPMPSGTTLVPTAARSMTKKPSAARSPKASTAAFTATNISSAGSR